MAPRNPSLSSMTAAEFAAALKAHGFRVVKAKIEDATAQSRGISWTAVLRGRTVDCARTLANGTRRRDCAEGGEVAALAASRGRWCAFAGRRAVPLGHLVPARDAQPKGLRSPACIIRRKLYGLGLFSVCLALGQPTRPLMEAARLRS
jgi:hypothetical protein